MFKNLELVEDQILWAVTRMFKFGIMVPFFSVAVLICLKQYITICTGRVIVKYSINKTLSPIRPVYLSIPVPMPGPSQPADYIMWQHEPHLSSCRDGQLHSGPLNVQQQLGVVGGDNVFKLWPY